MADAGVPKIERGKTLVALATIEATQSSRPQMGGISSLVIQNPTVLVV